jgi:hypothetical protein
MIEFKHIPNYYQPTSIISAYIKHEKKYAANIDMARQAYDLNADQVNQLFLDTIKIIHNHPHLNTPIYTPPDIEPTPPTPLQQAFAELFKAPLPVIPSHLAEILNRCIAIYQNNALPANANSQTKADYASIVRQAHEIGEELAKKFAFTLHMLNSSQKKLDEAEAVIQQHEAKRKAFDFKKRSLHTLRVALLKALKEICKNARNLDDSDSEVAIKNLCRSIFDQVKQNIKIQAKIELVYDRLVPEEGTATHDLVKLFEHVLATHKRNVERVLADDYEQQCIEAVNAKQLQALPEKDVVKDPLTLMKNILDTYLVKRRGDCVDDKNVPQYYWCGLFRYLPNSKSFTEKLQAVTELNKALNGEEFDLNATHLAVLRNGKLGQDLRSFIKSGQADAIIGGKQVRTISEFISVLQQQRPVALGYI